MTGEEGIEDGDVEEEIRRELEALNDWEDEEIAKFETESETTDLPTNPTRNKDVDDSTPESVETYIRLLQSRNTKLENGLIEVEDILKPSNKPNENVFQKTDGNSNEEISEEMKEKVLIEIEEFESNAKKDDQYVAKENISSLEEMGFNNLKELEEKLHLKSDRLENIFNEMKDEEMLRGQREETIREENKRKADEEYKMKVEENQIIKQKLEEEAKSKQRQLKDLEIMLEIEMKDLVKKQKEERLALQKIKDEEIKKQKMQKEKACITIQKNYRRYRVMLEHGKFLKIKRMERQEQRQEELDALERKERELIEEAVRKAKEEEERHLKEIEMEKERKKQEEERRRMEEERKKREEEERKEDARKRKEEQEQKKREEEEERKKREKEERKKKEEEDKNRKEEEERKKKKEDEKRKQEDEKKLVEEKRRIEDEQKKRDNEKKRAEDERRKREDEEENRRVQEHENKMNESQKNKEDKKSNLNVDTNHTNSFESSARSQNLMRTEILPDNRETANNTLVAGLQKCEIEDVNNETNSTNYHCEKSKTVVQENLLLGSGVELSGLSSEMEIRRAEWLKRTVPWSSVSMEENQTSKLRSRSRRPLSASQKLPSISEEEIAKSQKKFTFLEKVVHVNLKNLPARNLKIMLRCPNVKSVTVQNCGLLAAENFENCKHLKKLNLSDNFIQNINCQNIESLEELDLSKNQLTSVNGLDGCSNLWSLKLDGNKITRIGSYTSNKVMHLSLQNNQLITTKGVSQMKYMQTLDCSNNFLNHVEQLESCPLLRIIKLCGNNLQKPPVLSNHVLLRELHLSENSITSLESLSNQWLPLLQHLYVDNNSLSSLSPLQGFPMLETLDIRNNLISDEENLIPGLVGCHRLRILWVHGNPLCEDLNIKSAIFRTLPSLDKLDDEVVGENLPKNESMDTKIIQMCVTQILAQDKMLEEHIAETGNVQFESNDDNQIIERLKVQSRQFSELQDLIVKHRLQHENLQQVEQENLSGVLTARTPETTHNITNKPTGSTPLREKIVDVPLKFKEDTTQNMLSKDGPVLKEATGDPALGISGSQTCLERVDNTSVFAKSGWNKTHHQAATHIQARYRGFRIRKRYLEATKSAHYEDIDTGEEEEFNFDEEVDLSMFDMDEAALDNSWVPTSSVQLSPRNPAPPVADSPPFDSPPSAEKEEEEHGYRPFPPRHAWRSPNSPVSQYNTRRVIPPLDRTTEISEEISNSGNTTERSYRTSELSSEWGFSKTATAELMLKRAKKMKYNALRKKKLNDPGKRFELFKKTEEANKVHGVQPIQKKKGKQRIDYFTGRDSRHQQPSANSTPKTHEEENAKKEMTFSWVYNQAVLHKDNGEEVIRDAKGYLTESVPVKNRHERSPPVSLPRMDPVILAGRHLPLVASPVGNPRPSSINTTDGDPRLHSKHSWNQEKTHSNPDLTRAGLNMVNETREKSNSADARIMRERNNLFL